MTTVMFVEDDLLTRVGVASMIRDAGAEFEIVAEADNGRTALALARQHLPDIIVTDVQMPLMNGIELLREAKRAGLSSRFLILSAYDDYKYVREGMLLGAEDYVLKLGLEKENLTALLRRIADRIADASPSGGCSGTGAPPERSLLDSRRERFVYRLVTDGFPRRSEAEAEAAACGFTLPREGLVCVLALQNRPADSPVDPALSARAFQQLGELLERHGGVCGCRLDLDLYCFLVALRDSAGSYISFCREASVSALSSAAPLSLQLSEPVGELGRLAAFFSERCYFENGHYLLRSRQELAGSSDFSFSDELAELDSGLKKDDPVGIEAAFRRLVQAIAAAPDIPLRALHSASYILIYFLDGYYRSHTYVSEAPTRSAMLLALNKSCHTPADYLTYITGLQTALFAFLAKAREHNAAVSQAKQYIRKNFTRDIPLDELALHVGLTPSYFSRLFTQVTGTNFTHYLKEIRIARAKELLSSTNEKIQTIGASVGYANIYYFCRVFKNDTGMSPAQFRRQRQR